CQTLASHEPVDDKDIVLVAGTDHCLKEVHEREPAAFDQVRASYSQIAWRTRISSKKCPYEDASSVAQCECNSSCHGGSPIKLGSCSYSSGLPVSLPGSAPT